MAFRFTDDDMAQMYAVADEALRAADEVYRLRHPADTRSLDERVEDAWEADFTKVLPLDMAQCPYCGLVPALVPSWFCCKLNRWLQNAILDAQADQYDALLEAGDPATLALAAENERRAQRQEADPEETARENRLEHERQAVERDRRLEELYGVDVVREARKAQQDYDAATDRDRD